MSIVDVKALEKKLAGLEQVIAKKTREVQLLQNKLDLVLKTVKAESPELYYKLKV